jgi:hypothetical protein
MSNSSIDDGEISPAQIEFVEYHRPGLPDGDYEIKIEQTVSTTGESFNSKRRFTVSGPRFELKPQDIFAVFPPEHSLGEHSNVLPHIALNRSTLPWERKADGKGAPWLALLLFDAEEETSIKTSVMTLGQLIGNSDPVKLPAIALETGQKEDDKVTVLDVKKGLLEAFMPSEQELGLSTHVRVAVSVGGSADNQEMALIMGNRLGRKAGISTVHLVSVEERYSGGVFDYQGAGDDEWIRLVSLKSWSFACADENQNFKMLLTYINRSPSTFRLPVNSDAEAEKYLSMGYVPMSHYLREGHKTVSWYHGPLLPGKADTSIPLPLSAGDQALRYDPSMGMFDISYAAAWELGRLLALQSKQFSVSLYHWKRTSAQQQKQEEQRSADSHLPVQGQTIDSGDMPKEISSWLTDLSLLRGIPFNYLVPDAALLPAESIRFFHLDKAWVECLMDGAYSIGRVPKPVKESEPQLDSDSANPVAPPYQIATGFLLRSSVVSGWPGLQAEAKDEAGNELEQLRFDRLSATVLLCLFDGEINQALLHLKPETLHFGLDKPDDKHPDLFKRLRDDKAVPIDKEVSSIPWQQEDLRVISITRMADAMKTALELDSLTSAEFGLQMIEGVEEVIFQNKSA